MDDKNSLRAALRRIRAGIDGREEKERAALACLLALPQLRGARCILAYSSIGSEFPTKQLLFELKRSGKTVCLPRVERNEMSAVPLSEETRFGTGAFGIQEPSGEALDPKRLDLVLCPGLGFDRRGGRLGYGGGFYDGFLKKTGALRIGLCYNDCITACVPMDARDEKMDAVVTETGVIWCLEEKG